MDDNSRGNWPQQNRRDFSLSSFEGDESEADQIEFLYSLLRLSPTDFKKFGNRIGQNVQRIIDNRSSSSNAELTMLSSLFYSWTSFSGDRNSSDLLSRLNSLLNTKLFNESFHDLIAQTVPNTTNLTTATFSLPYSNRVTSSLSGHSFPQDVAFTVKSFDKFDSLKSQALHKARMVKGRSGTTSVPVKVQSFAKNMNAMPTNSKFGFLPANKSSNNSSICGGYSRNCNSTPKAGGIKFVELSQVPNDVKRKRKLSDGEKAEKKLAEIERRKAKTKVSSVNEEKSGVNSSKTTPTKQAVVPDYAANLVDSNAMYNSDAPNFLDVDDFFKPDTATPSKPAKIEQQVASSNSSPASGDSPYSAWDSPSMLQSEIPPQNIFNQQPKTPNLYTQSQQVPRPIFTSLPPSQPMTIRPSYPPPRSNHGQNPNHPPVLARHIGTPLGGLVAASSIQQPSMIQNGALVRDGDKLFIARHEKVFNTVTNICETKVVLTPVTLRTTASTS